MTWSSLAWRLGVLFRMHVRRPRDGVSLLPGEITYVSQRQP